MTDKAQEEMVLKHARDLGEHFENVLVMVSFQSPNGDCKTQSIKRRSGNWHACLGLAHEFISEAKADDVGHAVGSQIDPPDDDAEFWKML